MRKKINEKTKGKKKGESKSESERRTENRKKRKMQVLLINFVFNISPYLLLFMIWHLVLGSGTHFLH